MQRFRVGLRFGFDLIARCIVAAAVSAAIVFAACEIATAASDPADQHPGLHLIPWPKELKASDGHMSLSSDRRIVATDARLKPLAEVLSDEIALVTGVKLRGATGDARRGDIVLKINPAIQAGEPILTLRNREPVRTTDGAHTIAIGEQAVVEGFDYRATAEGTATVLQLIRKAEASGDGNVSGSADGVLRLPKLTIKDWPHADYCGAMLDIGRQDHPIESIKQVVQLCRLYKARYLQLHMTDDQGWTFPSTKYPQLGTKNYGAHGGVAPRVYKLDELQALVAYADARGVTLVPELEMPGHSGAALRSLPEVFDAIDPVSNQPVGMGCMNMSNEAIYAALDTIIGEMCDVFKSSPYFHIGSDEVSSGRVSLHPGYKAFMEKHRLANDGALADYFVAEACAIVKKHGKKAIKWEGMSNSATKDVIIMAWDAHSTVASDMTARGWTVITCPWNLEVPWEQWNMYVCNGSRLKKGDAVLGATLVAWEQPPQKHVAMLRNLAARQERTWGPDTSVTVEGFASRFQPLDALAGKLLSLPPRQQSEATFTTSAGAHDLLEPAFAFDGNDATYFESAHAPKSGDAFTVTFPKSELIHAIEVLTGVNGKGRLDGGDVEVSSDGKQFARVATLSGGAAKSTLTSNQVKAIRIRATAPHDEPMVIREINLQRMVEVAGVVSNPTKAIGEGNVAVTKGDTTISYSIGSCDVPIINRDVTLKFNNGGNPASYRGPISGSGTVEIYSSHPVTSRSVDFVIEGDAPNTMKGRWVVKSGRVVLKKKPGVDAMGGVIVVGDEVRSDGLFWDASDQINDAAQVELLGSTAGRGYLNLNGFSDTIGRLSISSKSRVRTDGAAGGGVLTVAELIVDGKQMPKGVYTSSTGWLEGSGYVVVGDVKRVKTSGVVENPKQAIGDDNIAVLTSETKFKLPAGECAVTVATGDFPLTLTSDGAEARFSGFITGKGSVRIETALAAGASGGAFEIAGAATNYYQGETTLVRGTVKLNKPAGVAAIPGDLTLGGSAAENKDNGVIWAADGQISPTATVTLNGNQPSFLDLAGHQVACAKVVLSKAGVIRTGENGTMRLKQIFVDGKRLADGEYTATQPWLLGSGSVIVDARVDAKGDYGSPTQTIGKGNVVNLVGDAKFTYPMSECDLDVLTNGFTLSMDSGDGNAFSYAGAIAGSGNVEFFMGPSYTGFKDAPLRLVGERPNTCTGKFLVRKGRVQLEKPAGVDAISGDVVVGGQGFNDCLFWKHANQVKDTANITLLDAGNSGAAFLDLNGRDEAAASLTLTVRNRVKTDGPNGASGTLVVKSLSVGGASKPAGVYTAATEPWIEGKGKVIVRP